MSIQPGDLVRGKYRVERVVGEGGMGVVVAAWDPDLERRVAIKFLHPEMVVHPEVVQRFLREARAAARIQSDHVALRGVVETDVFFATPAVFRVQRLGDPVRVAAGEPLLQVIPVPRHLLAAGHRPAKWRDA